MSSSEAAQHKGPAPYVLAVDEGEHLLLGNRRAPLWIKVGAATGSHHLTAAMERIRPGDASPVHCHDDADELIFLHSGSGSIVLGDSEVPIEAGSVAFVPRGTWHGPQNTNPSADLHILAVFSEPGMDGYFRAIGRKPSEEPPSLSPSEEAALERRYGITYR